ncbi:uncharacterized protein EI90DRAFT_2526106 [Cantharellus anzutake]|uniref:uncharacterized protein n=1 Tax=Cantharellus anzutake TaxID=1750568 RepID=UPI0019030CFA|nr:uncharacterized protein EI90DRAFT_2526106 [Cantharellus anzutake]KAF8337973.1 hypothetical protein EI90DRAFT_2526106 [Cantharellus anzutake]
MPLRSPIADDFRDFSRRARRLRHLRYSDAYDRKDLMALRRIQEEINVFGMFANIEHITLVEQDARVMFYASSEPFSQLSRISIQPNNDEKTHIPLYDGSVFRSAWNSYPDLEHLKVVRPSKGATIKLDNLDVEAMCRAWPNLRYLYLDPSISPETKVTLEGLVPFTRYCPNLEELHIGLDRNITHYVYDRIMYQADSAADEQPTLTPSKLRILDIGVPSIYNILLCVEFLEFLFPSLSEITVRECHGMDFQRIYYPWESVVRKVLGKVAKTSIPLPIEPVEQVWLCDDSDDDYGFVIEKWDGDK